mgnify:FL=1
MILALFENGLVTDVSRGENGGRALRNDFVVRRLIDLGALEAGKVLKRRLDEPWDAGWRKDRSGAALFLQDPKTLAVYDARAAYPLLQLAGNSRTFDSRYDAQLHPLGPARHRRSAQEVFSDAEDAWTTRFGGSTQGRRHDSMIYECP